ncbi:MAG: non-ribosomal peptide synthetase, partial [Alteromonadaceae bacterium]
LAVLKAGAAYVPISPEFPQERVEFILSDTKAPMVLTQQQYLPVITQITDAIATQLIQDPEIQSPEIQKTIVLATDDLGLSDTPELNTLNMATLAEPRPSDLAYVIYTSGTTGQPKGVMVEHLGVVSLIAGQSRDFGFTPDDRVIMMAPYIFDSSVEQLFLALLNGASLYLPSMEDIREASTIRDKVVELGVTYLDATPSYLTAMGEIKSASRLRWVISSGEAASVDLKATWGKVLVNSYGPTEASITATQCFDFNLHDSPTCIGKPVANTQVYVLSPSLNLVPIGTPGELYIGGVGVTRGYFNRAELSAERFIENPFASDTGSHSRLYKTGDLVRWLPDGNLEYLGRNDFQVKIRGNRIELGEIENALSDLPQVKQAIVIAGKREASNGHVQNYLAAYIVSELGEALNLQNLSAKLSEKLPDYMVPSAFAKIDVVPLTINGKLDRRALPTPEFISTDRYTPPNNAQERQLCELWQEVLGQDQVGIDDNFFRIGGDSIMSIQLVSRLRQAGYQLQVKSIFDAPTIAKLSKLLSDSADDAAIQINAEQGLLSGEFALLPIQQWFFEQPFSAANHWNQAFMVRIPADVDTLAIEQALSVLTAQHDMLRCRFAPQARAWQQGYQDAIEPCIAPLKSQDVSLLSDDGLRDLLTQWQSHFDYRSGPLWQAGHLTGFADGSARLFFAFHHLIIDAVSWRIIAQDVKQLLTGQALANKTSSYRQWVNTVGAYADKHPGEADYWQDVISDQANLPELDLAQYHTVNLPAELTRILLRQANQGYHTEINDLLLSALAIALNETFGREVNHITLEGHGREALDNTIDTARTVGWLTSAYPVRLNACAHISDTIIQTKEMLRAIPNKGIGFGALLQKSVLNADLPAVSFNYLGQLDKQNDSESGALWQLITQGCGRTIAAENDEGLRLDINGAVRHGVLQFGVTSKLSAEQSLRFVTAFEAALRAVTQQGQLQAEQGEVRTPSDYAVKGLELGHLRQMQQHLGQHRDIEAIYPAGSLQQGFVYHYLSQPQDDAYRVQVLLDYQQGLDLEAYKKAWGLASLRYPVLRMGFDWQEQILQVFTAQAGIDKDNFSIKDISNLPEHERDDAIAKIQREDRAKPFDLSQPGLIRFTLIKQHEALVTVLRTEHHSVSDGWSGPVLMKTVHQYYEQLVQGQTPSVEVETSYYAAQQSLLDQQANTERYWDEAKQRYATANDINAMLSQSIDLSQTKAIAQPATQVLTLNGREYQQLKSMCQDQGVTLNVALQFAWHKLLQTYTRDEQTIVGTTVSGRDIPVAGIESSVGLYINTLPLAIDWQENASAATMLHAIQQQIAALNSHSSISLASLQTDGERLFHSLFVFENYPMPVDAENAETSIEANITLRQSVEKADYPLTVIAYERNEALVVKLNYGQDWLNETQAQRLLAQLQSIVTAISAAPEQPHQAISLLSAAESQILLHDWNQTDVEYPQTTLHQQFEIQAGKTPDNIALTYEAQSFTYRELNEQANQLACVIRAKFAEFHQHEMPAQTLIALYLDRSAEMIVSILAVLKAGGAYVPISPEYPEERSQFILTDTQAALVLSQAHYMARLDNWGSELNHSPILLDVNDRETVNENKSLISNLELLNNPSHLAYVIYTSGTTGQPKGVMIEHKSAVNTVMSLNKVYDITPQRRQAGCFSDYVFDVSVSEIFNSLNFGGQLHLFNSTVRKNPELLGDYIEEHQLNYLFVPPAILALLPKVKYPSLHAVVFAGERCDPVGCRYWAEEFALYNYYGPTEAAVYACGKRADVRNLNEIGQAV